MGHLGKLHMGVKPTNHQWRQFFCNNNFHFIEQSYTKQTYVTPWNHLALEKNYNFNCKRQCFSFKWHMWILGPIVTLDKLQKIASHKRHHMAFNCIDSHILVTSMWDFSSIALDDHSFDVTLVKYCRIMGLPRFGLPIRLPM
jgi:hypothetical protein